MFSFDPKGGRSGKGAMIIESDAREGLDGYWSRSFPVTGASTIGSPRIAE